MFLVNVALIASLSNFTVNVAAMSASFAFSGMAFLMRFVLNLHPLLMTPLLLTLIYARHNKYCRTSFHSQWLQHLGEQGDQHN